MIACNKREPSLIYYKAEYNEFLILEDGVPFYATVESNKSVNFVNSYFRMKRRLDKDKNLCFIGEL
jgi:hypothetical protein